MDKILTLTKELKDLIEETDLVKEYRRVEALYKSNQELLDLSKAIKEAEDNKNEALRQQLVKTFNSNPLVKNYMGLKEDVFDYLKEITDIINK